jgi:hypothetical protein
MLPVGLVRRWRTPLAVSSVSDMPGFARDPRGKGSRYGITDKPVRSRPHGCECDGGSFWCDPASKRRPEDGPKGDYGVARERDLAGR